MSRRRVVLIGVGLAVAVAGAVVVPSLVAPAVAPPPPSASAMTVATAFWHAAEHRDCATMRAFSDSRDTRWCVSWWQPVLGEDPHLGAQTRFLLDDDYPANEAHVSFGVDMRGAMGASDGINEWGLFLQRTAAGWRVTDEGSV